MSHETQCGPIHCPERLYCDLHTRMCHGTLFSSQFISQSGHRWHMHHSSFQQPLFVHSSPSAPLYRHGHSNMANVPYISVYIRLQQSGSRALYKQAMEHQLEMQRRNVCSSAGGRVIKMNNI